MVELRCCRQRYQMRRGPRLLLLGKHTRHTTATIATRKSRGDLAHNMGISCFRNLAKTRGRRQRSCLYYLSRLIEETLASQTHSTVPGPT
jgi:hypothetical protein